MKKEILNLEILMDFLQKELKKSKHIMTWGTIGSLNIEHDIDTIITKKPNSSSANFYKEIHRIFESLDTHLKNNFGSGAVRISRTADEVFYKHLSKDKSTKIVFHTMIYTTYSQIVKDWSWALHPDILLDKILDKMNFLIGKREDFNNSDFKKELFYDAEFIYIYYDDYLNFGLPEKLLVEVMNKIFERLYKKQLGLSAPISKNREEIKKYFYELCNILDKKNKEKTKRAS